MGRNAIIVVWLVVNFLVVFSLALYGSGYTLKGYFPAYGKNAQEYVPILYALPEDTPKKVLYEMGTGGGIAYYYIWPTEETGKPLIDRLYDYVRRLFYGSEVDIEPITVYPENRTITFETYEHRKVVASFDGETVTDCVVNGTHVKVYVVTWNHAFSLYPREGTVPIHVTPEPMSPWEYMHYSIFRRANESIKEAAIRAFIVAIGITVLVNIGGYYLLIRRGLGKRIMEKLRRES